MIWISDPLLAILYRLKAKRTLAKVVGSYVFQKLDGTGLRINPLKPLGKDVVKKLGLRM